VEKDSCVWVPLLLVSLSWTHANVSKRPWVKTAMFCNEYT
jgi:hypothetical protein